MTTVKKILAIIVLLITGIVLYTFVLFDEEPFDNLRTGEIERATVYRIPPDETAEVKDFSRLREVLEDIELEHRGKRLFNSAYGGGQVIVTLYMVDGTVTEITNNNSYMTINGKSYRVEYETAEELTRYVYNIISPGEFY